MNIDGQPGVELTLDQIRAQGVKPEDIDSDWLDSMVKRLFKALEVQLARIEATKPDDNEPRKAQVRAANVRTLSAIERTLERLAQLEQQRAASRKVRTSARYDEIRAEVERRIDRISLTFKTQGDTGQPES